MGRLVQRLVFRQIQNGIQYAPVSRQVRDDRCQEPNRVLFVGVADHLSPVKGGAKLDHRGGGTLDH